jgi:hypothetical protein
MEIGRNIVTFLEGYNLAKIGLIVENQSLNVELDC